MSWKLSAGRWLACAGAMALMVGTAADATAQVKRKPTKPDKESALEYLVNPRPSFQVSIKVDRPDRTYANGETVGCTVESEKDGYLYVFYIGPKGEWKTFFPNLVQKDNRIKALTPVTISAAGGDPIIKVIGEPYGLEKLKAVVTTSPVQLEEAEQLYRKRAYTPVTGSENLRFVSAVAKGKKPSQDDGKESDIIYKPKPGDPVPVPVPDQKPPPVQCPIIPDTKPHLHEWAEDSVEYMTVAARAGGKPEPLPPGPIQQGQVAPPAKLGKRIGIFIGISQYDPKGRVGSLSVAHTDAEVMESLAKDAFKLEATVKLIHQEATKARIEETIRMAAEAAPSPNDFIMIFWSGHGGQCANTIAGSPGEYRQYLVPYDGNVTDELNSMVLDLTFAEWVNKLKGRKVLVVLDTCHSGGQIKDPVKKTKNPAVAAGNPFLTKPPAPKGNPPAYFMKAQLDMAARLRKQINQEDTFVLSACEANKPAFEMVDNKLSVLTYFVKQRIEQAGPVTPEDLFKHCQSEVPKYTEKFPKEYGGLKQFPTTGGKITPTPFNLKP